MKLSIAAVCAVLLALSNKASAATTNKADVTQVHIRVHRSSHSAMKFTHVSIGNQCAYDPNVVSAMYPCVDGGVCVRTTPTYGKCVTKEEAAKVQANATRSSSESADDSSDEEDSESDGSESDGSESDGSAMSSASSRGGVTVGDQEKRGGDEVDQEDDEEEDEDVDVRAKPLMAKA